MSLTSQQARALRKEAERLVARRRRAVQAGAPGDMKKVVHELQVHQIELELEREELRRALGLLEESRAKYTELFQGAPVGYLVFDRNGCILQANRAAASFLGSREEDLVHAPFIRFLTHPSRRIFYLHMKRVAATNSKQTAQLELISSAKGESRTIYMESVGVLSATGERQYHATLTDVTARHLMEKALTESQDRLALAQRSAGVGMWDWDMSAKKLHWSDELFTLFGLDPAKTTASFPAWRRVMHPSDRRRAEGKIAAAIREHKPLVNEYRIVKPSGEVRWIMALGNTFYDGRGRAARMSGVCIDNTDRKATADALALSEKKHRTIIETTQDGFWYVDTDGRFLDVNRAACRLLGYTRGEMLRMKIADIEVSERPRDVARHIASMRKTGGERFETKHRRKDGRIIDVEVTTNVFREAGKAERIFVFVRDITGRKAVEAKLRDERERFETLFTRSRVCAMVNDTHGRILMVNAAFCRFLGYTEKELCRLTVEKLTHPDDRQITARAIRRAARAGKPIERYEKKYIHKNGSVKWGEVNASMICTTGGKPDYMIAQIQDITERKKAKAAIALSEEKYRRLLDGAADAVLLADGAGHIIDANRKAEALFGRSRKELGQIRYSMLHPPEARRAVNRAFRAIVTDGVGRIADTSILSRTGRRIPVDITGSVVSVSGKKVVMGIFRDITDRKAAAATLAESEKKYRSIFDAGQDALLIFNMRGVIVEANPAAHRMYGYAGKELVGKTGRDIVHPRYYFLFRRFRAAIRRKRGFQAESVDLRRDGSGFPVEVKGSPIIYNGRGHLLAVVRDVTERKEAALQIAQDERRFRELFRHMSSAVAIYDARDNGRDFVFRDCNEALLRIEKLARKDVIGRSLSQVFPTAAKFGIFDVFKRVFRTGRPERFPVKLYKDRRISGWRENHVYKLPSGEIVAIYDDATKEKNAEAALRENEGRLQRIVREAPFPAILHASDGEIVQINRAWEALTGYSLREIPTIAAWTKKAYGSRMAAVRRDIAKLYSLTGRREEGEYVIRTKSGGRRVWQFSSSPVGRLPDGRRLIISMADDVTERKAGEERFRRFSVASGYGLAMGDAGGKLLFGNPAICRILDEKSEKDFLRNSFFRYYTRKDAELLRKKILPFVRAKGQWVGELPLLTARGKTVQTEQNIFLIRGARGTPPFVGNIITDISERKKAQAMIAEWKKSYEMIIAATGQVAYDYNIKTGLIAWGGDTEKVFGYPAMGDNIVKWAAKIHPDDRQRATALLGECMRKLARYELTYRYRHRNGRYLWVQDRGFYLPGPAGKAERMLGIMQDVTELKHLDEAKKELIRAVSHELKTPIGMSRMALDMLADAIKRWDMKRLETARGIIERNTERLDRDVENVLELFTLESIEALTHKARCSIHATVEDVLSRVRYVADFKKVGIRARLSAAADAVVMTKSDLKALVYNMLDNAIKFTEKGHVTISTSCRGAMVEIAVRDTGIGIAPDDKERLFTTFFKGHPALPGTGLGLAICRDIATRYGGTIAVESEGAGKGTLVTVRLPAAGRHN